MGVAVAPNGPVKGDAAVQFSDEWPWNGGTEVCNGLGKGVATLVFDEWSWNGGIFDAPKGPGKGVAPGVLLFNKGDLQFLLTMGKSVYLLC